MLLPADVVRTIDKYARDDREAGGILLGRYRMPHVEIVTCSEPMPLDVRTLIGFDRRDPGHQRDALKLWKVSRRTVTFIGEWHTHPEEVPSPSSIDLSTWAEAQEAVQHLPLIFVIRGYAGWWFGLGRHGSHLVKLAGISSESFDGQTAGVFGRDGLSLV